MEIDPSHNDALKNVCKVKEILRNYLSKFHDDNETLYTALELMEQTEEILAKG